MQRNQKGFSLIELIVVIAILAVLGSAAVSMAISSASWKCQKAAKLIDGALSETRVVALSKKSAYMMLYQEGEEYVLETSYGTKERLGSNLKISYLTNQTTEETAAISVSSTPIYLTYSRGTGAFQSIKRSVTIENGYCTYEQILGTGDVPLYCTKIIVTGGNNDKYKYVIALYKETGRHTLTKE